MIRRLVVVAAALAVLAAFYAWVLMVMLGALGIHIGFGWWLLPGVVCGVIALVAIAATAANGVAKAAAERVGRTELRLTDLQALDRGRGARSCSVCGCTDNYACPEGCTWVAAGRPDTDPELCTRCV